MATNLAIYRRTKLDGVQPGKSPWRFDSVEEGPGRRTGHLPGPFYIRVTLKEKASSGRKKQKWVPLDAHTFDAAKAERNRRERGESIPAENNDNRTLIADAVATFLENKTHDPSDRISKKSVQNYAHILNEYLDHPNAPKFIDQVNKKTMNDYVRWLETQTKEPKTVHNKALVVVCMLKYAGVDKPSKLVGLKKLKTLVKQAEEPAEPYSKADLVKLFDKMSTEETVRYTFFLVTACRESEVSHAQWGDLKIIKGVPHFTVQMKEFETSGGKSGEFTPKSHKSREIPLTRELVDMLTARKKTSKSDWIFPNSNGDPDGHFLRKFKKIAFEAGLNCGKCNSSRSEGRYDKQTVEKNCATFNEGCEKHYLHRLRKTRATFWHEEGITLRTIQDRLGHEDVNTTQKYLGVQDASETQHIDNKPMF